MRLIYCRTCKELSKVDDFDGDPRDDRDGQKWIDKHRHGRDAWFPDTAPIVFPMEEPNLAMDATLTLITDEQQELDYDLWERAAVETVKAALAQQQHDVLVDYRDQLKDDAGKCFVAHHSPEYPGKPCIDYHADSKRLSGRRSKPDALSYLCTYCPYESTVTVTKRALRGDYRAR